MTKVKICGLMDQVTVDETVQAGADYLGFVLPKANETSHLRKFEPSLGMYPRKSR